MDAKTKYQYQKRVKELEERVRKLEKYKIAYRNIFDVACNCADNNKHVGNEYILRQAKYIME